MKEKTYLERSKKYKGYLGSVLTAEMVEYIHNRDIEMFREMKDLFDKNGIRYMICGGTLLGAGTIGKFFPWDDDLDVCVFEEDYEKAQDILISGLSDGIIVQCEKTDPNYYIDWTKIRDVYSRVEPSNVRFNWNGVWIDLYPLKRVKKTREDFFIAKGRLEYAKRRLQKNGFSKQEYKERIKYDHLYWNLIKGWFKSIVPSSQYKYIIWSASKISLEEDWVFPLTTITFEGLSVMTFGGYKDYLVAHYGANYKCLPPVELRRVGINNVIIEKELKNV